jgi:hypothetical protein
MEIIPPKLTSYQADILFSLARFTITEASTKVGKTFSHIIWLYGKAHEFEDSEGYNYWWVAPVYAQAKIAFYRMRKYLRATGKYAFNETALTIKCPTGSVIVFKSADNPDNLYGEDVYAAVFDEAPRAKPEAWYALYSTLTATEAPCKIIGNFGGTANWVHQLKKQSLNDPNYEYFRVTCWDAVAEGILSRAVVEQAEIDLPGRIFQSLYLAQAMDGEGQLISHKNIARVFTNIIPHGNRRYITADIARLGKDKSVVMVWYGFVVVQIIEYEQNTIDEIVTVIRSLRKKHGVHIDDVIVDEDGVGGGVVDYLKCQGFVNGSKPIESYDDNNEVVNDLNFTNLKTQCYYKLAERANRHELLIENCDQIIIRMLTEELEQVRLTEEIDDKKIKILSKKEIKKEIGRSPDYSDCLMMREWFELNEDDYSALAA